MNSTSKVEIVRPLFDLHAMVKKSLLLLAGCFLSAVLAVPHAAVLQVAERDESDVVSPNRQSGRVKRQGQADSLGRDQALVAGQEIVSQNGLWKLVYQVDGNLVGYPTMGGAAFWNSGTIAPPGSCVMQGDGNLVLYNVAGAAYWSTGTSYKGVPPFYRLVMQNDRNIVVYDSNNRPVWNSGTHE